MLRSPLEQSRSKQQVYGRPLQCPGGIVVNPHFPISAAQGGASSGLTEQSQGRNPSQVQPRRCACQGAGWDLMLSQNFISNIGSASFPSACARRTILRLPKISHRKRFFNCTESSHRFAGIGFHHLVAPDDGEYRPDAPAQACAACCLTRWRDDNRSPG